MSTSFSRHEIAAIIPALNEAETIATVVKVVRESKQCGEIIVVSDGSTDDTVSQARRGGATRIIEHDDPRGKGAAVLSGIQSTRARVLLFLDADLVGLEPHHIEQLIMPVLTGAREMNIGLRDRSWLYRQFADRLPLISGERALTREIIEAIPPKYLDGYRLEIALNRYCKQQHRRFGTVQLRGVRIKTKIQKSGIKQGIVGYIQMGWDIILASLTTHP